MIRYVGKTRGALLIVEEDVCAVIDQVCLTIMKGAIDKERGRTLISDA